MDITQLYGYGVHRHVWDISSESAEAFRFVCRHFFRREAFVEGCIQLADGGWLIPRNDGTAGKHEFHRYSFIDCLGQVTFVPADEIVNFQLCYVFP